MLLFGLKKCVPNTHIRQFVTLPSCSGTRVKTRSIYHRTELKYANLASSNLIVHRFLNTNPSQGNQFQRLTPFMWESKPAFYVPIFQLFLQYWLIRLYIDSQFRLMEFLRGAKQAILLVSDALNEQRYEDLDGLVKEKAIKVLRHRVSLLTPDKRKLIKIVPNQFIYVPGHLTAKIFEGKNLKSIEILVFGACIREISQRNVFDFDATYFSYTFQRNYIDGIGGPWMIRTVNHLA